MNCFTIDLINSDILTEWKLQVLIHDAD